MGHSVQALIIPEGAVPEATATLEHTRAIRIGQGLCLVPITDDTFDSLRARFPDAEDPTDTEFWKLSGPIVILALQLSRAIRSARRSKSGALQGIRLWRSAELT